MSYTNLLYHIVFSTKDRRPLLREPVLSSIIAYMGGVARNLQGQLLAGNGTNDHLHLAAVIHPSMGVAEFVGKIKANSSRWARQELAGGRELGWQDGYAAFTVSRSALPRVLAYIAGQEEHHKTMTFQEELIALLKKHGVQYDPRHIAV